MSPTPPPTSPPSIGAPQAAARVAELQSLIAQAHAGPGATSSDFEAALANATGDLAAAQPLGIGTGVADATALGGGRLPAGTPFAAQIEAAAARFRVDPALLAGLIKAESNFDPDAGSPAGAQGLTQLMPSTAASIGVTDASDPMQAIMGGAQVLSEHLETFGSVELALAAYNAGPGAVQEHGGIPPYSETQAYVPRVLEFAQEYR
jgi:soluble lytic murein transglycosylase-like protein